MFRNFIKNISRSAVSRNRYGFAKDAGLSAGMDDDRFMAIFFFYRLIYSNYRQKKGHAIYSIPQEKLRRNEVDMLSGALCMDQKMPLKFPETKGLSEINPEGDIMCYSANKTSIQSFFSELNASLFHSFCKTLFHCLTKHTLNNPYINRTGHSKTAKVDGNNYYIDQMIPIKTSRTYCINQWNMAGFSQNQFLSFGRIRTNRTSNMNSFFTNPFFIY